MSSRKTKISFQVNDGATASNQSLRFLFICHNFSASFRSLILYAICLYWKSRLYIHFNKTLKGKTDSSKGKTCSTCMDRTSLPQNHILYGLRPPQASGTTERHPEKMLPGTAAAPSWNPHTQPGLTSFPSHFPPLGYTRGIIMQSKAGRLFQL